MKLLRRVGGVILVIFGISMLPTALSSFFLVTLLGWVGDAPTYSLQDQIITRGLNLLISLAIISIIYSGISLFRGKYGKLAYISFILTTLYLVYYLSFFIAGFVYYASSRN